LSVQRATKARILEFVRPLFVGIGFTVKMVYNIAFAWWLNPWMQRKANRALLDDITRHLYFLVSSSLAHVSAAITVLPSEWPAAEIPWENLLFTITRWHGETSVSVAPRHLPRESYELGPLVAALEHRHFSEHDVVNDLADAARLLRPRLQALNVAFSEQEFPRTRERL
jgi:hypothetical protein